MTATVNSPLVPAPCSVPDPIAEALEKLKDDPGALFEHEVLTLLRQVRKAEPARWARIRQQAKEAKTACVADLDKLTSEPGPSSTVAEGEIFPEVILWPDPLDGAALLDALASIIKRHVIADQATIHAAALWAAMTWFIDVVDAFLAEHDEARGILNAGFTRDSAFVIRCVGDDHTPTRFNVWGAKALCGIGKIADTLADRSIPLRLRRKKTGESTVKIRHANALEFAQLGGQLARFAIDNREAVRKARPAEIEGLNDRANDCWEPLLAVAEIAGGDWPRQARSAALALHGLEEDTPSIGAELLACIREAFDNRHTDKLSTADLLDALAENDESPWATWNRGKPMTPHQLAKRLGEFSITSNTVRIGIKTPKGYRLEQFTEAFERYLCSDTPNATATPPQPSNHGPCSQSASATPRLSVAPSASLKASNHKACGVVAATQPQAQGEQAGNDFEDF